MSDTLDDGTEEIVPQYDDTAPQYSPFGPEEAPGIQLVVQMRIYDVLMALLTVTDAKVAQDLFDVHASGGIIGTLPTFNPDLLRSDEN